MKPAPFFFHQPKNVEEALALQARWGEECKLLAGGQSLVPMLNFRLLRPSHIIDINGLRELEFLRIENGELHIGALTRHHGLARTQIVREGWPMLSGAAGSIGHYAIRQRGTVGGSLAHADPAAQLPLMAVVLDAEITLRSERGERRIPAASFFKGAMTTDIAVAEMIASLRIPRLAASEGWSFQLFASRAGDFADAMAAARLTLDPARRIAGLRLAVSAAEPAPRCFDSETRGFLGERVDAGLFGRIAEAASRACAIDDSPRMSASSRRHLVQALVRRALREAAARQGAFP
jgi:carbon-monoxide dehydrogenase medium subunit